MLSFFPEPAFTAVLFSYAGLPETKAKAIQGELTVRDYYRHPITGTLTPRLPDGWTASPTSASYSVDPGKWQRFNFKVAIPGDAKAGTLVNVGAQTAYQGATIQEIHPSRIQL